MRLLLVLILLVLSSAAHAYIGPGAGVSFLGSVWAVLAGIVLTVLALLIWPIRYLMRRLRRRIATNKSSAPPPVE